MSISAPCFCMDKVDSDPNFLLPKLSVLPNKRLWTVKELNIYCFELVLKNNLITGLGVCHVFE